MNSVFKYIKINFQVNLKLISFLVIFFIGLETNGQILQGYDLSKELYLNGKVWQSTNHEVKDSVKFKEINSKGHFKSLENAESMNIIINSSPFKFYGPLTQKEVEKLIDEQTFTCMDFRLFQVKENSFHVYLRPCNE